MQEVCKVLEGISEKRKTIKDNFDLLELSLRRYLKQMQHMFSDTNTINNNNTTTTKPLGNNNKDDDNTNSGNNNNIGIDDPSALIAIQDARVVWQQKGIVGFTFALWLWQYL